MNFKEIFKKITGNYPYPWQLRLYNMFLEGKIPTVLDIPTGLGKTSIIFIWLIALYGSLLTDTKIRIPSRLVYIVDRRVIVDQASDEVKKLQAKVKDVMGDKIKDLSVSTLRGGGGMADSRDWLVHPEGPAIIIGTVDMIGSRLCFSGYGLSNKIKPFYAGLLGQDSLIVLDETHLSPALEHSLVDIESIAQNVKQQIFPPKICLMSATQRGRNNKDRFRLNDDDLNNLEIKKRYMAEKHLHLINAEKTDMPEVIVKHALKIKEGRVLIYLQKPRDVQKVKEELEKDGKKVVALTGTLRGWERDLLTENSAYKSFLSNSSYNEKNKLHFLVATSAGEVGVDFDADHMLCDLTTFDSLIQRLGRVNRTGGRRSDITVVYSNDAIKNNKFLSSQLQETKCLLETLTKKGTYDASPHNLAEIEFNEEKVFAPSPDIQPLTVDILDMWSMTSIYEKYSSRPNVHHWLRGHRDYIIPDTYVAWREDVRYLTHLEGEKISDVLESYRILPHEIVRDSSSNVYNLLKAIARKNSDTRIIIVKDDGRCEVKEIGHVYTNDIHFATLLLPPNVGGLNLDGFLTVSGENYVDDVADKESFLLQNLRDDKKGITGSVADKNTKKRARLVIRYSDEDDPHIIRQLSEKEATDNLNDWLASNRRMLLVKSVQINSHNNNDDDDDDDANGPASEEIQYYVEKLDQQQTVSPKPQSLDSHLKATKKAAVQITANMGLEKDLVDAISIAAEYHDIGKERKHWQVCMHVKEKDRPLAKTGRTQKPLNMGGFRHELASVIDSASKEAISKHPERDLILHLIAAHHGWARPCFKPNAFSVEDGNAEFENILKRYSNLQKRFGVWGLAWLESIVRGADWQASKNHEEVKP